MSADEYVSFADDYHWFFDDVALRLGSDVPGVRAALAALTPGSRVLDAACGIGVDALWLRRHGHSVAAADASTPMVDAARARIAAAGADIEISQCRWGGLSEHFETASFDLVLCTGSAIAHEPNAASMIAALRALGAMLRPGGTLVVDTHDWDVVFASPGATVVDPVVVERDGVRCVRSFTWHLPDRPGSPAVFEPAVIVLEGDRATRRAHPIRLWPFTRAELRERLTRAGLEAVGLDAMPGDDRYTALSRAPG